MLYWNYRVIKRSEKDEVYYQIHEVYYNDKNEIESWTEEPVLPLGETAVELRSDIFYFLSAFKYPCLEIRKKDGKEELFEYGEEDEIFKLNAGHYFEVMDRAFVAASHFEEFVWAHPAVRKEARLRKSAKKIIDAMYEFYEETGRIATGKDKTIKR